MEQNRDIRIVIVDAMNVIYRSFFAIKSLSRSDGMPTNAVFGFIKSFQQLETTWRPTHMVVVFDGGLPESRLELISQYKAQRPAMPDDLRSQLPAVEEYLAARSVATVLEEGFEADDIMASIAIAACDAGADALIFSSDKDLLQVVRKGVSVISPAKPRELVGDDGVKLRMGVDAGQVVDMLALTGDTVDNIPGVPGVGPKTASKWLNQYGDLDGVIEHIDDLRPERLATALRARVDDIRKNVEVVRLDCRPDDYRNLNEFRLASPDASPMLAFFDKYEFHSLAKPFREQSLL